MPQSSRPIETHPSDLAIRLAELALSIEAHRVPSDVLQHAKMIVRDTVGVMLAGSRLPEVVALASEAPTLGAGSATLFGTNLTASSHVAALVNGTGGVSLELDEGNQFAVNHPGIHILPALIALAEERGSSGRDFLEAFIAGYEIAVRVGRAVRLRRPVHPFGTHTIVGTAVGAARLMGLDVATTARAIELASGLSIASSQSAATKGASVRNLFTGFTNHNGLLAPRLALAGFSGEPGALEVVFGSILGEDFALNLEDRIGSFYLTRNYFKVYACSRWNHAPIEAAAAIQSEHHIDPSAIERIDVHTYDLATRLGGTAVANAYAAKHSIAFNVAARLLHGSNAMDVYTDEIVHDPNMVRLIEKVSVLNDPELTALLPDIRAARVEIRLIDGSTYSARSTVPIGGFDNPLSEAQLLEKFSTLASSALQSDRVAELAASIGKLETIGHFADVVALMKSAS